MVCWSTHKRATYHTTLHTIFLHSVKLRQFHGNFSKICPRVIQVSRLLQTMIRTERVKRLLPRYLWQWTKKSTSRDGSWVSFFWNLSYLVDRDMGAFNLSTQVTFYVHRMHVTLEQQDCLQSVETKKEKKKKRKKLVGERDDLNQGVCVFSHEHRGGLVGGNCACESRNPTMIKHRGPCNSLDIKIKIKNGDIHSNTGIYPAVWWDFFFCLRNNVEFYNNIMF